MLKLSLYLILSINLFAKIEITNYENKDKFIRDSNSYGIYRFDNNKEIWIGEVRDDRFNGLSIIKYKNGNIDIVYQENDKVTNGLKIEIRDNYIYLGESENSKKSGIGIFSWINDEHTYIGQFENNSKNGIGAYILPDDSMKVGLFKDNKFQNNSSQSIDGVVAKSNKSIIYQKSKNSNDFNDIYVDKLECKNINKSLGFWKCEGLLVNSSNHRYQELSINVTLFDREDNISKIKTKNLNIISPNSKKSFQVLIQTRDLIKSYSATIDNLY